MPNGLKCVCKKYRGTSTKLVNFYYLPYVAYINIDIKFLTYAN